jgi:hypothetical protein
MNTLQIKGFSRDQPSQAERWARREKPAGAKLAVISSDVRYGRLLNLTDPQHCDLPGSFKREYDRMASATVC